MDRKTFLTAGGAILLTVVAASSAMAVNLGILDSPSADKVGKLEIGAVVAPTTTTTTVDDPEIVRMIVRDLPPVTRTAGPTAPAPTARVKANVAPSPAGNLASPAPNPAAPRLADDDAPEDDKGDARDSSGGRRAPREGRYDDD